MNMRNFSATISERCMFLKLEYIISEPCLHPDFWAYVGGRSEEDYSQRYWESLTLIHQLSQMLG